MLIRAEPFQHWLNHFYGYGSWDAKFWFVAYEEGGGDLPEEVSEKLEFFYHTHASANVPTLCDIRALYQEVVFRVEGPRSELFNTLYDYRFTSKGTLHGIWKNLIGFVHGYHNKKLPDLLTYQIKSFAQPQLKNEALITLYPMPSPHAHAWYYAWLDMPAMPFLKTRNAYETHVYKNRIHTILEKITAYRPQVVLMYGMNNINTLKKSVQEFFPESKFKAVKGTQLETPQHHRAELGNTTLILTTQIPALRHNRIETGFNWFDFGKQVSHVSQG